MYCVIIHTLKDSQDIHFMGNFTFKIPFTSVCSGVSSCALCGMPFLAEFYSKGLILETVLSVVLIWLSFPPPPLFFCFCWLNCLLFFPFVLLCFWGDFNLSSIYFISNYNPNTMYGIISLIV
jgi:NADH:ubiquinone oxidoreductase subunit 5 (subunit L)/multisubunit Na+/H+ antiporter MnhA subunit